jgi:hypothetical protein
VGTLARIGAAVAAPFPDAEALVASMANPESGIRFVLGIAKRAGKRASEVQSVIFDKLKWTAGTAKVWLRDHGFNIPKVDEGATFWRFRQRQPGKYKEFRTVVPGTRNPEMHGRYEHPAPKKDWRSEVEVDTPWPKIYRTRKEAEEAWYDSAPGVNDHATYKKVRGGYRVVPEGRFGGRGHYGTTVDDMERGDTGFENPGLRLGRRTRYVVYALPGSTSDTGIAQRLRETVPVFQSNDFVEATEEAMRLKREKGMKVWLRDTEEDRFRGQYPPIGLEDRPEENPHDATYRVRFIRPDQAGELMNLYHTARTALSGQASGRYERMLYASKWFHKEHPEVSETAAYKDLDGLLSNWFGARNPELAGSTGEMKYSVYVDGKLVFTSHSFIDALRRWRSARAAVKFDLTNKSVQLYRDDVLITENPATLNQLHVVQHLAEVDGESYTGKYPASSTTMSRGFQKMLRDHRAELLDENGKLTARDRESYKQVYYQTFRQADYRSHKGMMPASSLRTPGAGASSNPTHTITGPHGTMVRIWEQDGTFMSTFWVNGGDTATGRRATHSTLAGAKKWAEKVIQEHVGRGGYSNPTPGEAISAYDEHLATTLDPAFAAATPDEQAAAMTVQDAVENPAYVWAVQEQSSVSGWHTTSWWSTREKAEQAARVEASTTTRAHRVMHKDTGEVVATFKGKGHTGPLSGFYENPDLGQAAFDAAKDFRLSGAYHETGVANARVAKYGFTKWYNNIPPGPRGARSTRGRLKTRLLKNWMEGWAAGKRVEKKGNPESSAASLYSDFHGRPSAETLEIVTERHEHEWLTGLGTLVELKVATVTQLDATISFARDKKAPELCSSEDGRQLYIEGGDQALDLKALKMAGDKWEKDSMVIGVLYELTYQTAKKFHKFKLTDYFHKLGEETGVQPTLLYDPTNRLLSISGGQYQVKDVGIVN